MIGALALCRFLHFGAGILLWGRAAYGASAPRPNRWLWGLLALTGVAWLLLETVEATATWSAALDPATIWLLLSATNVGQAWALHLAFIAALGVALWRRAGITTAAALALVSAALVGHAASEDGWPGLLHRSNDALHLLSGGYWLGALPSVLAGLRRLPDREELGRLMRFSRWGHLAVAGVILTGVINTLLILDDVPWMPTSPYSLMLGLKIGLVAIMVGLAVRNRYVHVPQLSNGGGAAALRDLRRGTMSEIACSFGVLLLVSVFGVLNPV
ncbi:MAG: copper homeostasis membrane protein CopD [Alphaproteobacteria bacterium]|nr:copper homeostasis membrane protein CopD [Alphaproteobacteria bacterium]